MTEENKELNGTQSPGNDPTTSAAGIQSVRSGWDGKLRLDRRAVLSNPEALSDPEYSDEDAPPVEQIEADEGESYWEPHRPPRWSEPPLMPLLNRSIGGRRSSH